MSFFIRRWCYILITLKKIFKNLASEKIGTIIGNLTYISILSIAPTTIIILSTLNIFSNNSSLVNVPIIDKLRTISTILELNQTTNFLINLICINLLSSGIFPILSTFEHIYNFKFKNYIRKKLYSIALALIFLFSLILIILISFLTTKSVFFRKIDFLINLISIFVSILLLYKLTTFQKIKNIYSGALVSALFLTIFLNFFYYVINNFSSIKSYYGLLAPLIAFVLLIYYSCYIIYFGILLNIEFKDRKWIFYKIQQKI